MEMFWYREHFQPQIILFSADHNMAEQAECSGGVQNPTGTLNKEMPPSPQMLHHKE